MLKISTAAVSVNPPAASITPHITSKPIQSPQGNLVAQVGGGAQPVEEADVGAVDAGDHDDQEHDLPEGKTHAERSSGAALFFFFCFGFRNVLAAMGDPVNAAQHGAEQRNEVRNARQHLVGIKR